MARNEKIVVETDRETAELIVHTLADAPLAPNDNFEKLEVFLDTMLRKLGMMTWEEYRYGPKPPTTLRVV